MSVPQHTQGAVTRKLSETVEAGVVTSSSRSIHHYIPLPVPPLPQQHTVYVLVDDEQDNKPPPVSDSDCAVYISRDKIDQACRDVAIPTCPKVPHYLREVDVRSYVPQIVSIGPYHHGNELLRSMERHKWRSLQQILNRTGHDVNIYWHRLKEIEPRIRACYEGPISNFGSNEFVEMMLLDGCFILELFRAGDATANGFENLGCARNDPIFSRCGTMHKIRCDLVMLENQLPLFVLDLLHGIQLGEPEQKGHVSKLALRFFDPLPPTDEPECPPKLDSLLFQDSLHCLELFRRGLLRSRSQPGSPEQNLQTCQGYNVLRAAFLRVWNSMKRLWNWMKRLWRNWMKRRSNSNHEADPSSPHLLIHCVTELREAGIKFKKRGKTDRFWDVEFKNGILEIPGLLIQDSTKSLFLNLIAFEQLHPDCSGNITTYVIFMDKLINSAEDVQYLHHCRIVEHCLGSDTEVADLFNCLCREVVFNASKNYLSGLSVEVNKHYNEHFNHRWNRWRASLKHDYFSNPWAIISLFAAVILLLLTFVQTFYSVYGYHIPSGKSM